MSSPLSNADEDLTSRIGSLMSAFRSSGLSVDDFLREQLSAVRKDGEACSRKIIETLKAIDRNYASLQTAKANGMNR